MQVHMACSLTFKTLLMNNTNPAEGPLRYRVFVDHESFAHELLYITI